MILIKRNVDLTLEIKRIMVKYENRIHYGEFIYMSKRSTINDVARIAGVSKSTVSRYLNGKPLKEKTYIKIKEAIEECNYEANMFARLSAKRSNIIGIIVPGFTSTVIPRLLAATDQYLREKRYTPLIVNTGNDYDFELKSIENLEGMNVDGIIIVATHVSDDHSRVINNIKKPVIFLGQEFDKGISIVDDDYNAGKEIGRYVSSSHVDKIGLLWVDEQDAAVGQKRKQGVIDGLTENGIQDISIFKTDFSLENSYKKAIEIFSSDNFPKAIICATDRIAYGVYKAAKEKGIQIPKDVCVSGFGGYDTSEILTPSLTTIKFDVDISARVCAETLIKMIEEEPVSKTQMIGYSFIKGESI